MGNHQHHLHHWVHLTTLLPGTWHQPPIKRAPVSTSTQTSARCRAPLIVIIPTHHTLYLILYPYGSAARLAVVSDYYCFNSQYAHCQFYCTLLSISNLCLLI